MALSVSLFGEFHISRDGERLDLPASKKTRALLAYLVLNPRPHRRQRLCDMFWELTDDPRAALRWSLTKLRPLVNTPDRDRLHADRERVHFQNEALDLQIGDPADEPLAGLDLPDCAEYQAWLVSERESLLAREDKPNSRIISLDTPASMANQEIKFCRSVDDVLLAYATSGSGPPIVKAANWLTHLEFDWTSPIDGGQIQYLSEHHTLLRYDGRGNGLSDWDIKTLSFEQMVSDLESVVASAGLTRFPLIGLSQGAAVAIEFAARHPEKVSHLVLHGGFASGWKIAASDAVRTEREAIQALLTSQWGADNPSFRHLISTHFIPGATEIEIAWFSDFQRKTTSAENVNKFMEVFGWIDVRERLSNVSAPTLVMHSRGDQIVDLDSARELVAGIPNATFRSLDSDNHSLIDGEAASVEFLSATLDFVTQTLG